VADIVANRAFITPTECGHELVLRVGHWWAENVGEVAAQLGRTVPALLADAQQRDARARGRLTQAARSQLRIHRERLVVRAGSVSRLAPLSLQVRQTGLRTHSARLGPLGLGHLAREGERVRSWRRLLTAYDVERQLERGYSLTLDSGGRLVRSVSELAVGTEIVTRLADGTARSRIEGTEIRTEIVEKDEVTQ
jgi:exodeoxyribonuclease VII large subunit